MSVTWMEETTILDRNGNEVVVKLGDKVALTPAARIELSEMPGMADFNGPYIVKSIGLSSGQTEIYVGDPLNQHEGFGGPKSDFVAGEQDSSNDEERRLLPPDQGSCLLLSDEELPYLPLPVET